MSQDTIGKTIQLLGQIIQKPPLNQKLLSRPPFRYIHDIFSEIILTTGYFTGLYNDEEMKSENVKVIYFQLNNLGQRE
jgi:TRAF3-interacting protein 1